MPNFAIRSTPSLIAQVGTQDSLIRNTGNAPVYLDAYSSVTSDNYGLELQPMDSVNWAQGRELWAVTATGAVSTLSVLYGADGVSLGAVSAVVTGDVTATITGPVEAEITGPVTVNGTVDVGNVVQTEVNNTVTTTVDNVVDTTIIGTVDTVVSGPVDINGTVPITGNVGISGPVTVSGSVAISSGTIDADITGPVTISSGNVNVGSIANAVTVSGGGAQLYSNTRVVAGSSTLQTTITIPAGQPTYYGVKIYVELTTAAGASLRSVVVRDLFGNNTILTKQVTTDSLVGTPYIHEFTVPMQSSTYDIYIDNLAATTSTVFLQVVGVNVAAPTPTSNMSRLFRNAQSITVTPPAAGSAVTAWLTPSFQPYYLLLRTNSTSGVIGGMELAYANYSGGLDVHLTRAYNSPGYPDTSPLTNNTNSIANRWVPISGNGQPPRISFPVAGSNAGSAQLSIASAFS